MKKMKKVLMKKNKLIYYYNIKYKSIKVKLKNIF